MTSLLWKSTELFYLKSKENEHLFPSTKYALTHAVDFQNTPNKLQKKFDISVVAILFIILWCFLCLTFMGHIDIHMQTYNAIFGQKRSNSYFFMYGKKTLFCFTIVHFGFIIFGLFYILKMFCNYCIIQIETRPKLLPLKINQSVKETLQLLGYEGPEYKQLLKLDEQIYTTEYNFRNQLFIVEGGGEGNEFLVILPVKRDEIITYSKLPFTVCPILSIHDISPEEIYYSNGIYDELSIKMPKTSSKERAEYTRWLHKMLMEKSQRYREFVELKTEEEEIFEERHRFLAVTQLYPQWFGVLERLIVTYPVSARLIARFRFWRCKNSIFVKEEPILNEKCPLCLDDLVLNEEYAIWPCGSSKPHPFHYDCILDLFRTDERCPMCRKPATFQ